MQAAAESERLSPSQRTRPYLLLSLCALLPVLLYLLNAITDHGFLGHDLILHLTSWIEVGEAWRQGIAWPCWSARANFGLGDAHLGLYPPVSFAVGGLLALLLPAAYLPAAFVWVATMLAGVSMLHASRRFVPADSRLAAALLYMLSPYLLTTSLVRFAAAELLVQAWLPLLLLAFYEAIWERSRRAHLVLAGLLALTFLTNLPEAIVLFYSLLLASAAAAVALPGTPRERGARMARFLLAEALAASLSAFYLLPVWFEKNAMRQAALLRTDVESMLLFHGGAPVAAGLKVFMYGVWIITCGTVLLLGGCLYQPLRPLDEDRPAQLWFTLSAIAMLFNLPLSLPLWRHLPQLWVAQFPFRFLPLLSAALPLLLFGRGTDRRRRAPACVLLALLAAIPVLEQIALAVYQGAALPRFSQTLAAWNTKGYAGFPEYLPAGVTAPTHDVSITDTCVSAHNDKPAPEPWVETGAAAGACTVHLGVFFHPYWRAFDEQHHALVTGADADGRLTVRIPAGRHTAHLQFHRVSLATIAGLWLSLLACAFTLTAWRARAVQRELAALPIAERV